MQSVRIAFRNIARQKKRTALLGGAIAFGVLVTLLLGSFTEGLRRNASDNLAGIFGGHVYIRGEELSPSGRLVPRIGDRAALQAALNSVDGLVAAVQVRSRASGQVIFGSRQQALVVEGVDWTAEAGLWDGLGVAQGSRDSLDTANAIVLPESLAGRLGVLVGESVLFRMTTVTGQVNVGEFLVAATYVEQQDLGLAQGYAGIVFLNSLLGLGPDEYQAVNLSARRIDEMGALADTLREGITARGGALSAASSDGIGGGALRVLRSMMAGSGSLARGERAWTGTRFTLSTLDEIMGPVLTLVDTLDMVRTGLLLVLLLIIVTGLLNSFRMVLIERTREIGTLRAIGMRRGSVRNSFLMEALFLAIAGALAGLVAALGVGAALGAIGFGVQNALRVFMRAGRFSFPVVAGDVARTLLLVVVATLLAAWLPARRASRLNPADALRAVT
jgi:putative ABC transport system permease protein